MAADVQRSPSTPCVPDRPRPGGSSPLALACWLLLLPVVLPAFAEPDWNDYAGVLDRHVTFATKNGVRTAVIDYPAVKEDPAYWRTLRLLSNYPEDRLETREQRIAFYINAYNLLAIRMVLDNWPVDDIRRIGWRLHPVWRRPAGTVAGTEMSLQEIEHDILRRTGEKRIHMAIVCASVSCPDLRREPYTAARLEDQLEDQTQLFLANPGKGVRIEEGVVRISRIFRWHRADFAPGGGADRFIADYLPDLPPDLRVRANLPYDWSLNYKRPE